MRYLKPNERHEWIMKYREQWLKGEITLSEFIARRGVVDIKHRTWEGINPNEQQRILLLSANAIAEAKVLISEEQAF